MSSKTICKICFPKTARVNESQRHHGQNDRFAPRVRLRHHVHQGRRRRRRGGVEWQGLERPRPDCQRSPSREERPAGGSGGAVTASAVRSLLINSGGRGLAGPARFQFSSFCFRPVLGVFHSSWIAARGDEVSLLRSPSQKPRLCKFPGTYCNLLWISLGIVNYRGFAKAGSRNDSGAGRGSQ